MSRFLRSRDVPCCGPRSWIATYCQPAEDSHPERVAVQQYTVTHCVCNWFFQPIKMLPQLGYDSYRFTKNAPASPNSTPNVEGHLEMVSFRKAFPSTWASDAHRLGRRRRKRRRTRRRNLTPMRPPSATSIQLHPASSSYIQHQSALTSRPGSVEQLKLGVLCGRPHALWAPPQIITDPTMADPVFWKRAGTPNQFLFSVS